jgi:hypothetical protein
MKTSRNLAFKPGITVVSVLSIFLLFAAAPLWAKCPNSFVLVHGKIQCTFKPDYKVLVTLIYSEHQKEATGQTAALDIRDGSFSGQVAFSTFVSYNPLTGDHNCGNRPKSVLVRLIAADGTEWDRTDLKIADAFSYDENQGQYTLRSGLLLHGWCQSKCGETASTPCGSPK